MQLLERAVRTEEKEENNWLKVEPVAVTEADLEPQDYNLDIRREVRLLSGLSLHYLYFNPLAFKIIPTRNIKNVLFVFYKSAFY